MADWDHRSSPRRPGGSRRITVSSRKAFANSQAEAIQIDATYVNSHLGELAQDEDLSRYIL